MSRFFLLAALAFSVCVPTTFAAEAVAVKEMKKKKALPVALNFEMKTLDGKEVNLAKKYEGKVVLLVNVASKCGLTPQYEELQELHEKFGKQGLAIVGVPCNQFAGQEPGSSEEIATFCQENYGVEFDLLAKENVKSDKPDQCDLYKYLTSKETNPKYAGNIGWNFEKFLFNRQGEVVGRFEPRVKPGAKPVMMAIEAELAKK